MDKRTALQEFGFYVNAPGNVQNEMASAATHVQLSQGDYFVREGSACPQFALLVSGSLRVFKVGENGREITLYHVNAGQTCLANLLCALLDISSPASAVAETVLDVLIMPAASFRRWVRELDTMRTFVFQTIASRFIDLMTLLEEITFRKLDKRLADYLQRCFVREGFQLCEVTTTHEAIATELGSSREVISRLLKEFARLGAIETARGRIFLRNAVVLEQLGRDPIEM